MREIVFRGKTCDGSEWLAGYLVREYVQDYHDYDFKIVDADTGVRRPVNPDTVGQFTGMVDANDLMIYEGDILRITRFDDPYIGVVSFRDSCFISESYSSNTLMMVERVPLDHYDSSELTIVGTVHDNREMLGGLV